MSEKLVITKVGAGSTPTPAPVEKKVAAARKTMRTFPKGILKVKGVKDPAKPPPTKKTAKRGKIQLMTDVGTKKHRKTIRKKLAKMSNEKVMAIAKKSGLVKGAGTPPALVRDIVEGGAIAGFVSLD
jgi:hypothetical protein